MYQPKKVRIDFSARNCSSKFSRRYSICFLVLNCFSQWQNRQSCIDLHTFQKINLRPTKYFPRCTEILFDARCALSSQQSRKKAHGQASGPRQIRQVCSDALKLQRVSDILIIVFPLHAQRGKRNLGALIPQLFFARWYSCPSRKWTLEMIVNMLAH